MAAPEPSSKAERFLTQQYRLVGRHSAVKICHWCKERIRGRSPCYKYDFYGIDSSRCLEMTPAITCNQRCRHCWRDNSLFSRDLPHPVDEPKDIIQNCLKEREKLLIGFKGNEGMDQKRFALCLKPNHVAISLTGEPCLYPKLPELIKEFRKSGFKTIFLVTNGTVPEMLKRITGKAAPTNLYLSLEVFDKPSYQKFCLPLEKDNWEKLWQSMKEIKKLKKKNPKIRTVIRLTLLKHINMEKPKALLPFIKEMQPDFIECKGYMFVGYSRQRLKQENMPNFEEIQTFAKKLAKLSGYKTAGQVKISNIVLLKKVSHD